MDLNERQLEAVNATEGAVAVFACAGSGKTRVITHRIAHLIKDLGIPAESILACTFTNKAAGEMKQRVANLLGKDVKGLWIGTFHSICLRILKRDASLLGYKPNFTVYDEEDAQDLLKTVMRDLFIDSKLTKPSTVKNMISGAKSRMVGPSEFASMATTVNYKTIAQIYRVYQERLQENNAMDFDDLITKTIELLETVPEAMERIRKQVQYVLVDEYQDINEAQHKLTKLLAANGNIMVVGDDDQSIYAFRGASPHYMLQFERDNPNARVINLEMNYRSTSNVIQAAADLVMHNNKRHKKSIKAIIGKGENVRQFTGLEPPDEAQYVVNRVKELTTTEKRPYSDFAVLYRTNAQSRAFEDAFMANAIPYVLIGGIRFYQRKEIKDLLSYLRIAMNPSDSQSFKRAIMVPKRGIGPQMIAKLEFISKTSKLNLEAALEQTIKSNGLSDRVLDGAKSFLRIVYGLRDISSKEPAPNVIKHLIEELDIIEILKSEDTEEGEQRAENVMEFLNLAIEFAGVSEDQSLEAFLGTVSLLTDMDQSEVGTDKVVMTNVHQVKGLEFPVVFLCGLEEGIFPHIRSLESDDDVEEERRLAYVGMTRARERLYLSRVVNRHLWGGTKMCEPSRFLKEIESPEIINEGVQSRTSYESRPAIRKFAGEAAPQKKEAVVVKVGDIVMHTAWGEGEVVMVDGEKAEVVFKSVGNKLLNTRYAPIKLKDA